MAKLPTPEINTVSPGKDKNMSPNKQKINPINIKEKYFLFVGHFLKLKKEQQTKQMLQRVLKISS
ncbi:MULTISPECIES: hypothetical protein [Clostridium]|uniref:hypothetical protein n=1 Tax=Clostridium sp. HBUAS56017 TaxID=2571128 RepID=UPI001FA96797|nr:MULTISPECIES: hypothetical protein [Clostridium]